MDGNGSFQPFPFRKGLESSNFNNPLLITGLFRVPGFNFSSNPGPTHPPVPHSLSQGVVPLVEQTSPERWKNTKVVDRWWKTNASNPQGSFLVPIKGGNIYHLYYHLYILPSGGYILPTTFYGNQKLPLKPWRKYLVRTSWWNNPGDPFIFSQVKWVISFHPIYNDRLQARLVAIQGWQKNQGKSALKMATFQVFDEVESFTYCWWKKSQTTTRDEKKTVKLCRISALISAINSGKWWGKSPISIHLKLRVCHNHLKQPYKIGLKPETSPRVINTCQSLGLIFRCNGWFLWWTPKLVGLGVPASYEGYVKLQGV